MLNDSNGGKDWILHQVKSSQVYKRQEKTKLGSDKIYDVVDELIKKNIKAGHIIDE